MFAKASDDDNIIDKIAEYGMLPLPKQAIKNGYVSTSLQVAFVVAVGHVALARGGQAQVQQFAGGRKRRLQAAAVFAVRLAVSLNNGVVHAVEQRRRVQGCPRPVRDGETLRAHACACVRTCACTCGCGRVRACVHACMRACVRA